MIISDLPSREKRAKERESIDDVYIYDEIPRRLRIQIVRLWLKHIGDVREIKSRDPTTRTIDMDFRMVVDILKDEYGAHELHDDTVFRGYHSNQLELLNYFEAEQNIDRLLDAITIVSRLISNGDADSYKLYTDVINTRFMDNGVGYQLENRTMVRVDTKLQHQEVVRPALRLLNNPTYAGAEQEYLKAHEEYRSGDYEIALVEGLKAFESTMKIVCSKQGWTVAEKASASNLINVCFDNGLLDQYWKSHFTSLSSVLKCGVPTVRNKSSGHGQGGEIRSVPQHVAAFIIHSTAANIVLLIEAESNLPQE